jgi:hypothetical protein
MTKYKSFIFKQYLFDSSSQTAEFTYAYDDELFFTEKITFNTNSFTYNKNALDISLKNLFLIAGVSYYKAYLAKKIIIEPFSINKKTADFFAETYQRGLREFFYVNGIPVNTEISFPYDNIDENSMSNDSNETKGLLIGIGGGKDSLVSIECLKKSGMDQLATWSMGHKNQLQPLVERIGLKHYFIDRKIDKKLLNLNDAYNGHIPISAILACAGTTLSVLTNKQDVIVSNEWSANEPTIVVNNETVNHQYSKSIEFEKDYQQLLKRQFNNNHRYYSLLRSFNELKITKMFAANGFDKYKDVFCSCNKAFRQDQNNTSWCLKCPKCCFVFLSLSPFVERKDLELVFKGNPLIDANNDHIYRELLGETNKKPFECVGTVGESRWAMDSILNQYPELQGRFDYVQAEANNENKTTDLIPEDIKNIIKF